jgi:DNA (cytosine-5)-methyltransferase 1
MDEVVFILLSEKTNESKYLLAFNKLRDRFPRWEHLLFTSVSSIKARIKDAGMGRRRARLIKGAILSIRKKFGKLDLSPLKDMPVAEAEALLCNLPGIGQKAARCILLYCFDRPVLPVDIHTYRLAIRLGLLSRRVSYEQSHNVLPSVVPPELRRRFHVTAVAHGRDRCFAENPRCDGCALAKFCSHPQATKPLKIEVRPRALAMDIFSGAGGMSQGFKQAGFQIVQAIEGNHHAAQTYRENHPETDLWDSPIENLSPEECMSRVGLRPGDLTVLIGGPPCQGFSESNRRTRDVNNPKNHLYKQFVRFLDALQPAWFVMENVAGLKTLDKGSILNCIVTECRSLGYVVEPYLLNAADFGVPQLRRRLFIVGNRLGLSVLQPNPTHGPGKRPWVTVQQAIADLPLQKNGAGLDYRAYPHFSQRFFRTRLSQYQSLMRRGMNGATRVQGNLVTNSAQMIIERYKHIKGGQNWEAIPDDLMDNYVDSTRCHTGIYHRLEWDQPAKVIGNFRKNMLIHPRQHRGLSVREAARLQSFPDDYIFLGSIGFQQQQVADAVPPLLAEAVAQTIKTADAKRSSGVVSTKVEIAA